MSFPQAPRHNCTGPSWAGQPCTLICSTAVCSSSPEQTGFLHIYVFISNEKLSSETKWQLTIHIMAMYKSDRSAIQQYIVFYIVWTSSYFPEHRKNQGESCSNSSRVLLQYCIFNTKCAWQSEPDQWSTVFISSYSQRVHRNVRDIPQ